MIPRLVPRSMGLSTLMLLLSCAKSAQDTEGHTFDVDCSVRPCRLLVQNRDGKEPTQSYDLRTEGRYLLACAENDPELNCRPISCKESDPCAPLGGAGFACDGSYCRNANRDVTSLERLSLCLAGTGPWTGTPEQRAMLTLIRSAPDARELPGACR